MSAQRNKASIARQVYRRLRFLATKTPRAELAWLSDKLLGSALGIESSVIWEHKPIRYIDGASIFYQLGDIYVEGAYDFKHQGRPTILDVGANHGIAVRRYRERFPEADITAFEPDPALYSVLEDNVRNLWQDRASRLIQAAGWIE